MNIRNIELIVEKGKNGIWGRVNYNDNLIIEEADTLDNLKFKLKVLLQDFEGVDPKSVIFDPRYDVYS